MLCKIFIVFAVTVSIADNVFGELTVPGFSFPLHASCLIEWKWPSSICADIKGAIISQIGKWNNTNCGDVGEKCRYALKGEPTALKLEATHTTPVKMYVDDLTFTFAAMEPGGCKVNGKSTSETWYAVLDYGTNYCNLHNLIIGAGLNNQPGYTENTSNSVCTQYSTADCDKY